MEGGQTFLLLVLPPLSFSLGPPTSALYYSWFRLRAITLQSIGLAAVITQNSRRPPMCHWAPSSVAEATCSRIWASRKGMQGKGECVLQRSSHPSSCWKLSKGHQLGARVCPPPSTFAQLPASSRAILLDTTHSLCCHEIGSLCPTQCFD